MIVWESDQTQTNHGHPESDGRARLFLSWPGLFRDPEELVHVLQSSKAESTAYNSISTAQVALVSG